MMPAKKPDPPPFSGFPVPKQNWFKMPNEWIDLCADLSSLAEIKIVQYVMRHTWGHHEYGIRKRISLDEFMNGRQRAEGERMDKGTGLSKPSVISGIKSAVRRGLLIEEIDNSDRARLKKYYSLRMHPDTETFSPHDADEGESDPERSPPQSGVKNLYPDVKNFYPRGKETLHRTKKDTLERHLEKENNNNTVNGTDTPVDDDVVVALSHHGVGKRVAQRLAATYPKEHVLEKIDFIDFLIAERPNDIQKPAAWLRKAIEEDYAAPDGFISPTERDRLARETAEREQELAQQEKKQREQLRQREIEERQAREEFLAQLHQRYGTTKKEEMIWQQFLEKIEFSLSPATLALFQSAAILKIEDARAVVGVKSTFQAQQMSHPGMITVVKRQFKILVGREIEPELVVIADLP